MIVRGWRAGTRAWRACAGPGLAGAGAGLAGLTIALAAADAGGDLLGSGPQRSDDRPLRVGVGAEHRVRIVVLTGGEQRQILRSRAVAPARHLGARRLGRHGHDCLL